MCAELKTTDLVPPLTRLIGSAQFKLAEENCDYDLFGDIIDTVKCVGFSDEVNEFFEAAKKYCVYSPIYTPDVVFQLCALDNKNAARHIWDLRKSLNMYYANVKERRGQLFSLEIDRFKSRLANLFSDSRYQAVANSICHKHNLNKNDDNLGWIWLMEKFSENLEIDAKMDLSNDAFSISPGNYRQEPAKFYNSSLSSDVPRPLV